MTTTSTERDDLILTLDKHRGFLLRTVRDLTDEQAAARSTVSALCVGGLIKHVAAVEDRWRRFIIDGPAAFTAVDRESGAGDYLDGFRMLPGETLEGLLAGYQRVAETTDRTIRELPSLEADQPLPEAPWFEPGARWSARRVVLHILAETAQHAGHADIIREALDGAKTMG